MTAKEEFKKERIKIMGEYADMEIERDLSYHLDDEYLDKEDKEDISIVQAEKWEAFDFLKIKQETEKAWLLIMNGSAEQWFPKKYCRIKDNTVYLPIWLRNKITVYKAKT